MFSGCLSVRLSEVLVREISQEQVVKCVGIYVESLSAPADERIRLWD